LSLSDYVAIQSFTAISNKLTVTVTVTTRSYNHYRGTYRQEGNWNSNYNHYCNPTYSLLPALAAVRFDLDLRGYMSSQAHTAAW